MNFDFDERPSDSPFVEKIWRTQSERNGSFISAAASQWEMVVTTYNGQTTFTVRGPETKATPADYPADAEFFGIVFKVGTFMPQLPLGKLRDRNDATLPGASSQSFWLHGSAWQIPDFENADTFVARLVRQELIVQEPVVQTVLQNRPLEMSLRSVQRRFLHATGLTRGTLDQIERARPPGNDPPGARAVHRRCGLSGRLCRPAASNPLAEALHRPNPRPNPASRPVRVAVVFVQDSLLLLWYDIPVSHKQQIINNKMKEKNHEKIKTSSPNDR